jgi:hypothetical protein
MIIERFKAIAVAASRLTSREISDENVRAWANRYTDPLPVTYLAGRPGIDERDLAAWLRAQEGKRRASPGTREPGKQLDLPQRAESPQRGE